jgi:hypothetical protein
MLRPAILLCLFFSILSPPAFAVEVTNLKTQFSSTQLTIEYDLLGNTGEKETGVEILLDINGTRYSSHMLSISGDFGSSIGLGKSRRIVWTHPQDFPEGLDAKFKCIVNAVQNSAVINEGSTTPSEGFRASFYAVNKQTIVDTRTRLMWTRNANIPIKPMMYSDAEKMIKKLNQERFAGYSDWRLPTLEDFEGLVFFGKKAGWGTAIAHFIADYLTTCGFTRVQSGIYWTSTTSEDGQDRFITANTWNGIMRPLAKNNFYYLWPVRTVR